LGATPLGEAAGRAIAKAVPVANFAKNAGKLNGHTSSVTPAAGQIPVVGTDGKLPASIGAVGPAGPKGDTGAKGNPGATNVVVRNASGTIPAGSYGHAIAECNAGEKATGGGAGIAGVTALLTNSQPNGSTGWFGQGKSTGPADAINVYVVCASP
jgi:hypothetical protein